MDKYKFRIDEKSLFFGIYNNYKNGQTATVSTPLNQSKDPLKWRNEILDFIRENPGLQNIPEILTQKATKKTTAQANTKINNFFEFKNIKFNGLELKTNNSFGMYVKEEIDMKITNREGKLVDNTHFGRLKLHYPITLKHLSDGLNIDNKKVLESILEQNGGFAFVVRGFEICTKTNTIDFVISMIGIRNIALSEVFKIQKGVGKKLRLKTLETEEFENEDNIPSFVIDLPQTSNFSDFEKINKSRVENGKLGEEFVYENIKKLLNENVEEVHHTSKDYPTSPYDIECIIDQKKVYLEVKATSGDKKVFNMSSGEIKFMEKYKENYKLILVTNVKGEFPNTNIYSYKDIINFDKVYPSTRFFP